MDIRELKQLLKNSASVLVLDNGEPAFVLLDYSVYRNLIGEGVKEININREIAPVQGSLSPQEVEAIERLNKEIQDLKEQIDADQGGEGF